MRLQLRLFVVMVIALLAVAGILVLQHRIDLTRTNTVLKNETIQRKSYFEAILSIDQQPLKTLARDYSFWDEMVEFVSDRNPRFAEDNIDTSLSTFNADAAWVYNIGGQVVYESQIDDQHKISTLPLSSGFIAKLQADKFEHFFVEDKGTLVEVRAATIVPGDDPSHLQPASGYWFVARKLDAAYLAQLSNLSQSQDELLLPGDPAIEAIKTDDKIDFTTTLSDWGNKPVAVIKTTYEVPVISDLNKSYVQQLLQIGIFGAILIIVITAVLYGWVLRPIRRIILSITTHKPALLDDLTHSRAEFGRLARTVQQFFEQKNKIAEDAIRRADLENLNKEKTVFLSMAAHELKGPISIVHMITGDLPSMTDKLSPVQLNEQLETVTHQASKMAMIINDLQSASQGDVNNTIEYDPTTIDFDAFIKQEIKANQLITTQKIHFSGGTKKSIYADPLRMSQVLSNLIRNAAKYAPGTDRIDITTEAHGETVILKIKDYGIGIAQADQKKIFHRFYRASNAVEHFRGLGIGLSVCERIVKESGGTIRVESALQKGSTFTVELNAIK